MNNRQTQAKRILDEQHSDLCKMWGLFGAGCDCGATKAAYDRIVRETSADFRAALLNAVEARS